MVRLKRIAVLAGAACLFVFGCLMLTACGGDQIAATWAHGEVKEDDVTTAVTNMQQNYGLTDASSWQSFIENKYYDPDSLTSSSSSSSDSSSSSSSSSKKSKKSKSSKKSSKSSSSSSASSSESGDSSSSSADSSADSSDSSSESSVGTVADLRTYVINQLVRQQVIDWEVEQQNIQVSDEEVDAYVDTYRKQVEKQYMEGVFESYLENTQGITLDEFKEQARKTLAEQKLQEQVTGSTTDTDAWDKYVDGLVSYAEVKINDAPANLSYDPANMSSSSSSSDDSTAEESTDTASETSEDTTSEDTSADSSADSSSSSN